MCHFDNVVDDLCHYVLGDEIDVFILADSCEELSQLIEVDCWFVEDVSDDVEVFQHFIVLVHEDWHCCCWKFLF